MRSYPWSSYSSYMGRRKPLEFVDYGPVLALMACEKKERSKRYREFVEAGLAETDEEFLEALKESRHSIGSQEFRDMVSELYQSLVEKSDHPEDVMFRKEIEKIPAERILQILQQELGVSRQEICRRHRDSVVRPIASKMLCKYGGLTQREVARILGLKTGTGISLQLRKLPDLMTSNARVRRMMKKAEKRLSVEHRCMSSSSS